MTQPRPSARAARTQEIIAACRARGMSATALRRALGLSEAEAVLWGIALNEPVFRDASPPGPTFDDIARAAAHLGGAFLDEMCSPRADGTTALARSVAMHLMRREIPDANRAAIAGYFDCSIKLVDSNARRMRLALANPMSREGVLLRRTEEALGLLA